jgi:YbbR domain-containing protein
MMITIIISFLFLISFFFYRTSDDNNNNQKVKKNKLPQKYGCNHIKENIYFFEDKIYCEKCWTHIII